VSDNTTITTTPADQALLAAEQEIAALRQRVHDLALQVSPQGPGWKVVIHAPDAWFAQNEIPYTRDPDGRDQVVAEAERAVDGLLNSE